MAIFKDNSSTRADKMRNISGFRYLAKKAMSRVMSSVAVITMI